MLLRGPADRLDVISAFGKKRLPAVETRLPYDLRDSGSQRKLVRTSVIRTTTLREVN